MDRVEIIAVGRELLQGQVLDSNSHWLAGQVTALGGEVRRIVVVDDVIDVIATEIRTSMGNGAKFIITVGGLGPTFDDQTLEGVAKAINKPLQLDPKALGFVKERYEYFSSQGYVASDIISPEREKMARLPQGAAMLPNPIGAAPGIWLDHGPCHIISLPGVPQELKTIFNESIAPRLKNILGPYYHLDRVIKTPLRDESQLTSILHEVRTIVPQVYIKSKPTHFGLEVELEVCLTASGEHYAEIKKRIGKAIEEIERRLPKDR